ncbi:MAG: helicase-related protein [Actinomycetes bacterium]
MFDVEPSVVSRSYGYHPRSDDAPAVATNAGFSSALILGPDVPDFGHAIEDCRLVPGPQVRLPRGTYWFCGDGETRLLVVSAGDTLSAPLTVDTADLGDDHALVRASEWFDALWDTGLPIQTPRFEVGDEVVIKSRDLDGIIRSRACQSGRWLYEVRADGRIQHVSQFDLQHHPDDDDPAQWVKGRPDNSRRFAATLTRAKLDGGLTDTVFSFRATRTLFRPYQFRPVLKLLETGKSRLLVADEGGLGKTIEAGLIWTELEARLLADRVLVLCPSSLIPKWKHEMEDRFGFELQELDAAGLRHVAQRLQMDRLPRRLAYVCSIERMRAWQDLELVSDLRLRFDLVIVDEAHAFRNLGTRSYSLGALVSEWAEALIFLSATPLNLGNTDLYNLLDLLTPGEFGGREVLQEQLKPNAVLHRISDSLLDRNVSNAQRRRWFEEIKTTTFGAALTDRLEYSTLDQDLSGPVLDPAAIVRVKRQVAALHALSAVVTRTRKVDIQDEKATREARAIDVSWSATERAFYDAYFNWCVERAAAVDMHVGFVMQMPLRIASACLQIAKERVLNWEDPYEFIDADDPDADTKVPSASSLVPPNSELTQLAQALAGADTKYDRFLPVLRQLVAEDRRVLVFTFSKETIAYLESKLKAHVRVAVLHGGVKPVRRQEIMAAFRRGEYDVVVANRVASEGLDFEFCSAVVNYDLPWNPMEVEQRIGRIDRIGQTEEKIHIVNFYTPDTIETEIISRVLHRIGVFKDSIGALEPIIQSHLPKLRKVVFDFSLSPEQRAHRSDEILAAIEEQALTKDEVEAASSYLLSSDGVSIEGLESSLLNQGRYVGQRELALLVDDWAQTCDSGSQLTSNGRALVVRGNSAMAEQVRDLAADGHRSTKEVEATVDTLLREGDLLLSLDQEWSREGGPALLTANHPLVRAALRVKGHRMVRFAQVELDARNEVNPGTYLVQLGVAKWKGLRPSTQIWSSAVDLSTFDDGPADIGDILLARLATANLQDSDTALDLDLDLEQAIEVTKRRLLTRMTTEQESRQRENEALLETRRISDRVDACRGCGAGKSGRPPL